MDTPASPISQPSPARRATGGWRLWRISRVQALILCYLTLILVGFALLLLPMAHHRPVSVLDTLFTAVSAATLTGLTTVDTAASWTLFGKCVLLGLMQLGGIAAMTFGMLFAMVLGLRVALREHLNIGSAQGTVRLRDAVHLVPYILLVAVITEAAGACALAARLTLGYGMPFGTATFESVFHAVSAFCNGGFALQSFHDFHGDLWLLGILAALIILGGLGFGVLMELALVGRIRRFTLRTKLVLVTSLVLIFVGFGLFYLFEWNNVSTLGELSGNWGQKAGTALFMAVSPRTAGFSVVDLNFVAPPTLFVLGLLMLVGASPDSTGGGLKTTTLAVIVLAITTLLRKRADIETFGRRIGGDMVRLALSLVAIFLGSVLLAILGISLTEITLGGHVAGADTTRLFGDLMFEVVSAFTTSGLSTGITPGLLPFSKAILMACMFLGRVGPLIFVFIYAQPKQPQLRRLPAETVMPG